ncbi:MAG: hypothetical protein OEW08_00180 [Gammaproteobacteria bacterium]|nr:hypothetical protein [Gammaproteobacteria bacterium]
MIANNLLLNIKAPTRRFAVGGAAVVIVFTATWLVAGQPIPLYTMADLGKIGYLRSEENQPNTQRFRINDSGFIVGTSVTAHGQQAVYAEVRDGRYSPIAALPVSMDGAGTPIAISAANAVNIENDVVGWEEQAGQRYATLWTRDADGRWSMKHLQMKAPYTSSMAWDINDRQEIVGSLNVDGVNYAAYWHEPSSEPDILGVVDGNNTRGTPEPLIGSALAINNEGVIAGVTGTDTFIKRPSELHITRAHSVGGKGYLPYFNAVDINAAGVVAANAVAPANRYEFSTYTPDTPWVWSRAQGLHELIANADTSAWATSINDAQFLIGHKAEVPGIAPLGFSNRSPFMYHLEGNDAELAEWQAFDLRSQLPALPEGWEFHKASSISNNGRIAVMAKKYDDWHLYVLNPAVADLAVDISPIQPALWTPDATARAQLAASLSPQVSASTLSVAALRIHNLGPTKAQNIVITGSFDTVVTIDAIENSVVSTNNESISSYCLSAGERKGRSTLTCHIGQLAADDFADIVVKFSAQRPGEYQLEAQVTSTTSDVLNHRNNRQTARFNVLGLGNGTTALATQKEAATKSAAATVTVNQPDHAQPAPTKHDLLALADVNVAAEFTPTPTEQPTGPPPLALEGAGALAGNAIQTTHAKPLSNPFAPPPLTVEGPGGQAVSANNNQAGGCSLGAPGQHDSSLPFLLLAAGGYWIRMRRRTSVSAQP